MSAKLARPGLILGLGFFHFKLYQCPCVIHIATHTDGGYIHLCKFCGDLW